MTRTASLRRRLAWLFAMLPVALAMAPSAALAQAWPDKPLRIMVGASPGGDPEP